MARKLTRTTPQLIAAIIVVGLILTNLLNWQVGTATTAPPDGWQIALTAELPDLTDRGRLVVGAGTGALPGYDEFDQPLPPAFPLQFLDLYTQHEQTEPGWENQPRSALRYQAEYGSPLDGTDRVIDFFLETDRSGPVTITWSPVTDPLLDDYEVILHDHAANTSLNLRTAPEYTISVSPGVRAFSLAITFGRQALPQAAFTFTPVAPSAGEPVQFNDTSTHPDGTIVAWAWDFGDGSDSAEQHPVHVYGNPGTYTVTLIVTDDEGETGFTSRQVRVTLPPTADFTFAPDPALVGESVQFTDLSTDDGEIVAWTWQFGDGSISTLSNPVHAYAAPGIYTVTLTVRDDDGATDTESKPITVQAAPVADFTFVPPVATVGEPVQFTDLSTDEDGEIVTWNWDFGDGTGSTEQHPAHVYSAKDSYTVTLVVTDNDGLTATAVQTITALIPPTADFTFTPAQPLVNQPVQFTDLSADEDGAIVTWDWDFGDGTTSTVQHPTHAYSQGGLYTVSLTVTDDDGATATAVQTINISAAPIASFAAAKDLNVAQLEDGATVVDFSSVWSSSTTFQPENAIDYSTSSYWRTGSGEITNQWLKVRLTGERQHAIERVVLRGSSLSYGMREFEVRVSTTGSADADFTTILTGTVPQDNNLHTFTFDPVPARYVQLNVLNNHGHNSEIRIYHFEVRTRDREGGIVSLFEGPPATIIDYSSQRVASESPERMIEANTSSYWRTAVGQVTDQWAIVELGGTGVYTVDQVRFRSSSAAEAPRDFAIRVSTTTPEEAAFTTVFTGTAASTTAWQAFSFAPVEARYVQLFIYNNQSSTSYIRVNNFEVLAPDGANLAKAEGVGAFVVDFSSVRSTATTYQPENAIAFSPSSRWETGTGQTTDQWISVRLLDGEAWLIDRVSLIGVSSTEGPKDFAVRVSTSGLAAADFTTVLTGTLPSDNNEHWFTFAPVEARYVQLFIYDNHGSTNRIRLHQFRVFSTQLGEETVPFDDLSTDPNGHVVAWAWDFGDGSTATEQHPLHTFAGPGTYPVQLTVTDDEGLTDTLTVNYTVLARPVADFVWSPEIPNEGQTTTFSDRSTSNGRILTWRWQFPHRSDLTSQNVSTSFPDNDEYEVILSVTDSQLLSASTAFTVTTLNLPPTVNAGANQTVVWGQSWSLNTTVSDPGVNDRSTLACVWEFGDGQSASIFPCNNSSARVPYAFALPGVYTATLTVTDKDGDSASDSLVATVNQRETFIHIFRANTAAGGQVEIQARLYDTFTWNGIVDTAMQLTLGDNSLEAITDENGIVSVLLPFDPGEEEVTAAFAGDAFYHGYTVDKPIDAPRGDIVFMVDESGSMGPYIQDVRARVVDIARQLGSQVDFHLGLIGFGAGSGHYGTPSPGMAHIHTELTNDLSTFVYEVDQLVTSGGIEPGFQATVLAMSDEMSFRPNAGVCAVMITDESATENIRSYAPETREDALAALNARNAVFLGIVRLGYRFTADDYGPNPGSLSVETGGAVFSINTFGNNPDPVLEAIFELCIERITTVDLEIAKEADASVATSGEPLTYTVTVSNVSPQVATGVVVTDILPAYTAFVSASNGGTASEQVVTWPAFTLPAGASVTRTVTLLVDSPLPPGVDVITNTALVADDGTHGFDPTPSNNVVTVTTPVFAAPDLVIDKMGRPDPAQAGALLTYTLTISNVGTQTATGVQLTDTLPAGVTPVSLASECVVNEGVVTCSLADLTVGETTAVQITVIPTATGTLTNTAVVASNQVDLNPVDNTVTITTEVSDFNRPPQADAGGPYLLNEGDTLQLDGTGSFDPDGDPLNYRWDFLGETYFEAVVEIVMPDDFVGLATLTVDDGWGGSDTVTTTVTVLNVPPAVDAGPDQTITEGETVTVTASFTDPGLLDTHTAVIDWGDGTITNGNVDQEAGSGMVTGSHIYPDNGVFTVTVTVTDKDGGVGNDTLLATVLNAPPVVDAGPDQTITEGGTVTVTASFTDPGLLDTHTAVIDWGDGTITNGNVDQEAGSGMVTGSHIYPDNGVFTVTVTVTDKDGGVGSDTLLTTVLNAPPVVDAGPDQTITEGGTVTVTASFTDPGLLDTHTAVVDWGDGLPPVPVVVEQNAGSGSLTATYTYGDDGIFTVTITVVDNDGDSGSDTLLVTVLNLPPTVTLDTADATQFAGGLAFTGRAGLPQSHQATATDPGSDDLIFIWDFGHTTITNIYYNDGFGPDPYPSPHGVFPFTATDMVSVTFFDPGLYTLVLTVEDDDGGFDTASLPKLVTGDADCTRSQGFWRQQFHGRGHQHVDNETLLAYLTMIDFASAIFSEQVPAATLAEARAVLWHSGSGMRARAEAQLLAAWLNYAHGTIGWVEMIDTNGDGVPDTPFYQVIYEAENLLLDPSASHQDLERAKDLAEAINLHDAQNPLCP